MEDVRKIPAGVLEMAAFQEPKLERGRSSYRCPSFAGGLASPADLALTWTLLNWSSATSRMVVAEDLRWQLESCCRELSNSTKGSTDHDLGCKTAVCCQVGIRRALS